MLIVISTFLCCLFRLFNKMASVTGLLLTWFEKIMTRILRIGPIPKHVAFIMDGNRRYAKKIGIPDIDSQRLGCRNAQHVANWCVHLGITEITISMYSVYNFKRSRYEIDNFLDEAFQSLSNKEDIYNKMGVCIRVVGNLELIPQNFRNLMARLMLATKDNKKMICNLTLGYSSREEITNSIQCIIKGVENGMLNKHDIDEQLITNCLYTNKTRDIDLYIRTSGVTRVGDFLLWHFDKALLCYFNILWPEFSFWYFIQAILYYQLKFKDCCKIHNEIDHLREKSLEKEDTDAFINDLEQRRWDQIEKFAQD